MECHRLQCSEIWGGFEDTDQEVETAAIRASLYSHSSDGGKGGDIYYFSVCGQDQLTRIAMADVIGHGEVVSRISEWVYGALLRYMNEPNGSDLMTNLNNTVQGHGVQAMTTAALASLVVADSHFYVTYAGHPPILLWQKNGSGWRKVEPDHTKGCNIPLGIMKNACYDQSGMVLEHGDKLFLYTDGVIEAPDPHRHLFGERRLVETLNAVGDEEPRILKQAVLDALETHTAGALYHDDLTFLAVEAFP